MPSPRAPLVATFDLAVDPEQLGVLAREPEHEPLAVDVDEQVAVGDPAVECTDDMSAPRPPRNTVEKVALFVIHRSSVASLENAAGAAPEAPRPPICRNDRAYEPPRLPPTLSSIL